LTGGLFQTGEVMELRTEELTVDNSGDLPGDE
jgi:hypothetical protein